MTQKNFLIPDEVGMKLRNKNKTFSKLFIKNFHFLKTSCQTYKVLTLASNEEERLLEKNKKSTLLVEKLNSTLFINTDKTKENEVLNSEKKIINSYSKLHELKLINIGLASAKRIKQWSEKTLPNGKVIGQITNANTLHHKSLKPQKGGLFCERIFGPLKDFECACGKNQKPSEEKQQKIFEHQQLDRVFCPKCDVEYTWSVIRRYQLGYIQLVSPVTHAWYLKATPSYLSILLDIKKRHLEYIVYSSETMTLEYSQKLTEQQYNSPGNLFKIWQKSIQNSIQKKESSLTYLAESKVKFKEINSNLQKEQIFSLPRKSIKPKRYKGWRNNSVIEKLPSENIFFDSTFLLKNYFKKYVTTSQTLDTQNLQFIPIIIYVFNRIKKLAIKKSFIFLNEELFQQFYTKIYGLAYKKFQKYIVKKSKKLKLILNSEIKTSRCIVKRIKNSNDSFITMNNNSQNQQFEKFFIYKKFLYKLLSKTKFFRNKNFNEVNRPIFLKHQLNSYNYKSNTKLCNFLKFQLIPLSKNFITNNWNSLLNRLDLRSFLNLTCSNLYSVLRKLEKNSYLPVMSHFKKLYIYSLNINQIGFLITNIIINILFDKMITIIKDDSNIMWKLILKEKLSDHFVTKYHKTKERKSFPQLICEEETQTKKVENQVFDTMFKPQNIISVNNSLFLKERLYESTINSLSINSQIKNVNSVSNNLNSITNNIYSLSHRYRWTTEKDWKQFIDYFGSVPDIADNPIPNYKSRIKNSQNLANESGITGTLLIQKLLEDFNFTELKKIDKQNRILLYELNKNLIRLKKALKKSYGDRQKKRIFKELYKKRDALIRRTKLIRKLFRKDSSPNSMILSILPVLPPDLRPIIKVGGQIAASDLNRLYQRVIYRNERLKKFLKDPATINSYEMKYAQRLLQEAVDNLIQNGNSGLTSEKDAKGRVLKSLSDVLKGKQGRFRQHLLGKRVDYSGRSVIVVGPKLKLYECGLPKEMALELFLPFIIKKIISLKLARTVIGAKTLIKNNKEVTYDILREIMINHPILLNRAPTLHRLGIQAFQPKLVEGRAILLHPLVCPAFNADFDGDQMAVHVPITVEARTEAWKLMFSRNNLLSPATGEPIVLPSQDMVLGCYYLTTENFKANLTEKIYFSNFGEVLKAYKQGKISIHTIVWVRYNKLAESGNEKEEPIEIRITTEGYWMEIYKKTLVRYDSQFNQITQFIKTTPGRILFNELIKNSIS